MCPPPDDSIVPTSSDHLTPAIPQDGMSLAAYNFVKAHLQPSILAHSLRVFNYAIILSRREPLEGDSAWHSDARLPLLFTACMFHDFGACSLHDDGPYRFEVEGADAAVRFLQTHGQHSEADTHAVWVAIACHTSPHIGERISLLGKIMRQAPLLDFHRVSPVVVLQNPSEADGRLFVLEDDVRRIEGSLPRADIEKVLSNSVVAQARRPGRRYKAPGGSWSGDLIKAADAEPEWQGVNKAF